jgi:ATP-dependent DNA ligase
MEWTPVVPAVVVEVGWRHSSGGRFRHGVRLIRFRPDTPSAECTFDQIAGLAAAHPSASM